jgi:hypothetical protein
MAIVLYTVAVVSDKVTAVPDIQYIAVVSDTMAWCLTQWQ